MTTTEKMQSIPDFYLNRQECLTENKKEENQTNIRYSNYTQRHFTAGDEEQFESYRDAKNYNIYKNVSLDNSNLFREQKFKEWSKYKNVDATAVINTFRYIFNKFKKGIFVKIANNKLVVFLPFSKACYRNEWSKQIKIDPKFKDLYSFLQYVSELGGYYKINNRSINPDIEQWYGNNCIMRYDMSQTGKYYYPAEGDTNIGTIKNMLENLCKERKMPDIEFFINRRDFPLLTRDETEPYNNIWDSYNKHLISHNYPKYVPILSMATSDRYADIAMPTYEDWARVQGPMNVWFPKNCAEYNTPFNKNWESKKSTAVFRGSSTGCGVTINTNNRLKLAYLSHITKPDEKDIPYIDAGITKWNLRPRKIQGSEYLQTIDIKKLPFSKVNFLSAQEQSNYKYIINVDGHVSAFRLSLELNMGSVILMVDSEWELWYKNLLIPYKHYVPIKSDLSNLVEQIKWCRMNDKKCKKIVDNSQLFFHKYLQRNGILDYMQKTLVKCKEEMGIYFYNSENILDAQISKELESFSYNFPSTSKTISDINVLPFTNRNNSILQAMHWIFNMIISKSNIEKIGRKDNSYKRNNKLSTVTKWNIAGFDFILKSATDSKKIMEHIHDVYVGIESINELTKSIPNFAYTFGYYKSEDNTANAIIEYISGETLYDYIRSKLFSFEEYLFILIQISLALEIAQKKCGLVHYDITPWNIILQRTQNPITIDYVLEYNNIKRVKTNIIPVIIDYGKAHTIVDQEHHGFVNMFSFSSSQDIITLLIKSIDLIISEHNLGQKDSINLLYLSNFITGTQYRRDKFNNLIDLQKFMKKVGKYSCLIYDDKYDLNNLTPMEFIKYIYKLKEDYPLILSFGNAKGEINNIMNKSNSRQIFDYTLSNNNKEKIESYINVFIRLKSCPLPFSNNLLLNYYSAQTLEYNLLCVKNDMLNFLEKEKLTNNELEKVFTNTTRYIKRIYDSKFNNQNIRYNLLDDISTISYTDEIFLQPEKIYDYVFKYKDYEINDLTEYKHIIESILINNGTYKLSDTHRKYYLDIFSQLLNINSYDMLYFNANINTIRKISGWLYSKNKSELKTYQKCDIINKQINKYNNILKLF